MLLAAYISTSSAKVHLKDIGDYLKEIFELVADILGTADYSALIGEYADEAVHICSF